MRAVAAVLLDLFMSVLVLAFGLILLLGVGMQFFKGEPWSRDLTMMVVFATACVWLGFRMPFSMRERA